MDEIGRAMIRASITDPRASVKLTSAYSEVEATQIRLVGGPLDGKIILVDPRNVTAGVRVLTRLEIRRGNVRVFDEPNEGTSIVEVPWDLRSQSYRVVSDVEVIDR